MATKQTDLDALLSTAALAVHKRFARKGLVSERADKALAYPSGWVSTGSLALDHLCRGILPGGFPLERIVHIAGEWSTGKSLLLDHLFKSVHDIGGLAFCAETEGSRDLHFAEAIGLNLARVHLVRPDTLEQALDAFLEWHDTIRSTKGGATVPIVAGLDSLDSATTEKSENAGLSEGGGWHYGGGKSEALAEGLRRISKRTSRYPTTFVLLNQTREAVGVMFGPKKRTPGGNPPHFYASLELMLSPGALGVVRGEYTGSKLSEEQKKRLGLRGELSGQVVGRWVRAKVTKTKCSSTYLQEADFYLDFNQGLHRWGGLQQRLLLQGIIHMDHNNHISHAGQTFESAQEWLTWLSDNLHVLHAQNGSGVEEANDGE